jgi:16S rRNA (guanine527-N7)-methyltransferase
MNPITIGTRLVIENYGLMSHVSRHKTQDSRLPSIMNPILKYFPGINKEQIDAFEKLPELYEYWNERINVISRKDIEHLSVHHILHSLSIAKFISFTPGTAIVDVGTGGGFPGIPLAIYFPHAQFLLVDSIGKKISVVKEISEALNLKNVRAVKSRAEELEERFDFVVSRAVAPMADIIKWTRYLINSNNHNTLKNGWIFLKGGNLEEEIKAIRQPVLSVDISTYFNEPFFETKKIVYTGTD